MVSWTDLADDVFQLAFDIHSTAVFIMFIYEEACQVINFATFLANSNYDVMQVEELLDYLKNDLLKEYEEFISKWGWLGYPASITFSGFIQAEKKWIEAMEKINTKRFD